MDNIENVLDTTLKNLRDMIDTSIVIGEERVVGEDVIIPVCKVSLGFVSGGGEYGDAKKMKHIPSFPYAGGSSGGCNITPIGFLVVSQGKTKFIRLNGESEFEKILGIISHLKCPTNK